MRTGGQSRDGAGHFRTASRGEPRFVPTFTWPRSEVSVGFDHATHAWVEHAVRIDFTGTTGADRAAVELDLASGKALLALLQEVIARAERSGVTD